MAKKAVIGSLVVELTSDTVRFVKGLDKAGSKARQFERRMQSLGSSLTKYVTLPMLGVGASAFKAAMDWETAFTGVRKTVDATEAQFKSLSDGIRAMATEIPASAREIASVAEAAGQLGIQTDAILSFSRVMVDLGETTDMAAQEAAMSLAQLANITQMPQRNFDRLGSTVVALGNELATTERRVVDMGLRIAGAGKQVGLSEAQILSLAGALSSVGIEAEAGGTAISRIMLEIDKAVAQGTDNLAIFADTSGMVVRDFREAWEDNALATLVRFVEGLGQIEAQGGTTHQILADLGLDAQRVGDSLRRAAGAGDLFNRAMKIGSQAWDENVALAGEASKRYGTTASRLKILNDRLTDLRIELGTHLLPVLEQVESVIKPVFQWFNKLSDEEQGLLVKIGLGAAVGGPAIKLLTQLGTAAARAPRVALFAAAIALLGAAIYKYVSARKEAAKLDAMTSGDNPLDLGELPPIDVVGQRQQGGTNLYGSMAAASGMAKVLKAVSEQRRTFRDMLSDWAQQFEDFGVTIDSWADSTAATLTDAIMGWRTWGDAVRDVINMVISDLIRMQLKLSFIEPLSDALRGFLRLDTPGGGDTPGQQVEVEPFAAMGMPALAAAGAPAPSVHIHNHIGQGIDVSAVPRGGGDVDVFIESKMLGLLASGKADPIMSSRYGTKRRPVGR